jgi:hypothetical protein
MDLSAADKNRIERAKRMHDQRQLARYYEEDDLIDAPHGRVMHHQEYMVDKPKSSVSILNYSDELFLLVVLTVFVALVVYTVQETRKRIQAVPFDQDVPTDTTTTTTFNFIPGTSSAIGLLRIEVLLLFYSAVFVGCAFAMMGVYDFVQHAASQLNRIMTATFFFVPAVLLFYGMQYYLETVKKPEILAEIERLNRILDRRSLFNPGTGNEQAKIDEARALLRETEMYINGFRVATWVSVALYLVFVVRSLMGVATDFEFKTYKKVWKDFKEWVNSFFEDNNEDDNKKPEKPPMSGELKKRVEELFAKVEAAKLKATDDRIRKMYDAMKNSLSSASITEDEFKNIKTMYDQMTTPPKAPDATNVDPAPSS